MIDTDFNKWPLHDAPITTFIVDWQNKTCKLNLKVFLHDGDAVPCEIIWKNITEIYIPKKHPWSGSVFILDQKKIGENEFLIQMQSGDEIKICANEVELIELNLNS